VATEGEARGVFDCEDVPLSWELEISGSMYRSLRALQITW
jgi:hypothetical protein